MTQGEDARTSNGQGDARLRKHRDHLYHSTPAHSIGRLSSGGTHPPNLQSQYLELGLARQRFIGKRQAPCRRSVSEFGVDIEAYAVSILAQAPRGRNQDSERKGHISVKEERGEEGRRDPSRGGARGRKIDVPHGKAAGIRQDIERILS
jgi:hypothetical protein